MEVLEHSARMSIWIQRLSGAGFAFLGVLTIFSGLVFFFGPPNQQSAISQQLSDSSESVWNAAWLLAGVLVLIGSLKPGIVIELIGQFILAASFVVYSVAILTVAGLTPAFFLVIVVIGFVGLRIYFLTVLAPRLIYLIDLEVLASEEE